MGDEKNERTKRQRKAEMLRRQAALMREAAAVRTNGGHRTNRMLKQLATKLEEKAENLAPETDTLQPVDAELD